MTVETKTTIQLSDIKALELTCKNCNRIVIQPSQSARSMPVACNCGSGPWMILGGQVHADLAAMMELIEKYGKANNEPFGIRLVIGGASDRASSGKD